MTEEQIRRSTNQRDKIKKRQYAHEYNLNNLAKREAERIARKALRKGEIVKSPCLICDSPISEMHHDDYTRPLDVKWFCRRHHVLWESHLKE